MSTFLGVDIAGQSNTWVCCLAPVEGGLQIIRQPRKASLVNIVDLCATEDIVAIAIDAQLTSAISEENGMRSSDNRLREMLPSDCQAWVQSQNCMMAVPVRGRQLADAVSPLVGTIIETHPRASLLFALPHLADAVREYKKSAGDEARAALWRHWTDRFGIKGIVPVITDGAIDALVCATTAYLYHRDPAALVRLSHEARDRAGRGPFYVLRPTQE